MLLWASVSAHVPRQLLLVRHVVR